MDNEAQASLQLLLGINTAGLFESLIFGFFFLGLVLYSLLSEMIRSVGLRASGYEP